MPDRHTSTPPLLSTEHRGGGFVFRDDIPPPPGDGPGPLTRRVIDIFSTNDHGSPSAPVLFGLESHHHPDQAPMKGTT